MVHMAVTHFNSTGDTLILTQDLLPDWCLHYAHTAASTSVTSHHVGQPSPHWRQLQPDRVGGSEVAQHLWMVLLATHTPPFMLRLALWGQ